MRDSTAGALPVEAAETVKTADAAETAETAEAAATAAAGPSGGDRTRAGARAAVLVRRPPKKGITGGGSTGN
ncbi:hypothetical protein OH807_14620 [Kitasatospora sp. NBC_01560]|uniref:hypothetical protein n=1 Tax=Kitasatospora sp. NBC_01560 TaxID=2975965 RepID=UPI003868A452